MTLVEARAVGKRYGAHLALSDVSFTLVPGVVTALVGANGSGKSTLLKRMIGLVLGSGQTTFDGRTYPYLDNPVSTVGLALDVQQLDTAQTPRSHLTRVARACGAPAAAIDEFLAVLDLSHVQGKRVAKLSLGMRQRLSLAAALLPDPEVLLLDEPGNGMDPAGLHWLQDLVRSRAEDGRTVLLSSHLLTDVEACADRILVVDRGRLLFDGDLESFVRPWGAAERVIAKCGNPELLLEAVRGFGAVNAAIDDSGSVAVDGLDVHAVASAAVAVGAVLHEVRPDRRDLDTAYFDLLATRTATPARTEAVDRVLA
ncbi:ATP-binding cassette domain-containing protein [Nocardioides sp.]|uniref:ATP-binding cassette domain-containing protein n=1 Tax=Nocardioides sp. TaxID=35761 RepID=UPI003D0BB71A